MPRQVVMPATGHRTESSFNRYVGVDEAELVATYRQTAHRAAKKSGADAPAGATHSRAA